MTADRESLIRRPIKELMYELDPDVFLQIHRGTLVNVNAIAGVTRDLSGKLRVRLKQRNETLPVSDPYVHLFRSM
jgi:DNA-binding LytR/AlgR family response regulator